MMKRAASILTTGHARRAKDLNGDSMTRLAIIALGALTLSGCAGSHLSKPPVCDGKHRRPANLYGSILPTLPVPLPASQQAPTPPMPATSVPAPPPDAGPTSVPSATPQSPPAAGASGATASPPQTSRRDVALSYFPC
jgi:hypothetical protein